MSNNGKDDTKDQTVNFDALELEEGDESSQQMKQLLTYLKENMEPEKYSEVMTLLGVGKDMSNTDLFEKIKGLMAKKPGEEGKEDDDPDEEKDKLAEGEEGEKPDRAAFMKKCMEGGKDLAECTEEFKKKYPEPAKEEGAKTLEIPDDVKAQLKTLEDQVSDLTKGKELAEVSTEVEKLISEKHLAPVQREAIIKMSAKMDDEDRAELLDFFRTTQKLGVHRDVGVLPSDKPGGVAGNDLSVERKKELIKLHGLTGLIEDKADRGSLSFLKGDN